MNGYCAWPSILTKTEAMLSRFNFQFVSVKVPFQCPLSWIGFEGSCYRRFTDKKDWNSADTACKANGAQLVKIESAEENDLINSEVLASDENLYWIGLTDAETEDDWKWSDGSQLTGYTNWMTGEPNNIKNNQHCAEIAKGYFYNKNYNGEWNDQECSKVKMYICEKR